MEWVQNYDPLGSAVWSTMAAGLPIVVLMGLLLWGVSAPRSALAGLAAAIAVAIGIFKMPVTATVAAATYGGCFGLLPIGWIVLSAVFLYHLTVRTGQFEIVKHSLRAISPDQRMQALLIAFCFGTFLEGAAGFGTPVAISAALLIGLGFSPLYAAGLALLANTSPVAFGSLGLPIVTLAKVSGIDEMALCQMAGRQLTLFSLIIPFWIVGVMAGWKGIKGCWPAILVCGSSYAIAQFCISNWYGPALVNTIGGITSLVATTLFLRVWQPKEIWRFPEADAALAEESPKDTNDSRACTDFCGNGAVSASNVGKGDSPIFADTKIGTVPDSLDVSPAARPAPHAPLSARAVAYAWTPWLLLSVMIFLWGWPTWKEMLNGGKAGQSNMLHGISKVTFEVPGLHNTVYRTSPVVKISSGAAHADTPEPALYDFNWLTAAGTSVFLAAVLSALWLRISPAVFFGEFVHTLYRVRWALFTIACMLALAFTTKYSGADATLGLAFTRTGWLYPFFAPMLGWLGVALTGSDTSCNALFGSLQRITAEQLGLNPVLIVASNSTGGVMGKMIDAQSIVVAAVATEQSGGEGAILRFVFFHSLILAVLVGLLTLAQAYLLPWMIPVPM